MWYRIIYPSDSKTSQNAKLIDLGVFLMYNKNIKSGGAYEKEMDYFY